MCSYGPVYDLCVGVVFEHKDTQTISWNINPLRFYWSMFFESHRGIISSSFSLSLSPSFLECSTLHNLSS